MQVVVLPSCVAVARELVMHVGRGMAAEAEAAGGWLVVS
jgi:hypothetical protein